MVASTHPSADECTVLIVEDERDLAELYTTWFSEVSEPVVAHTGSDARARLCECGFEVVLLDRVLPDSTGDELLDSVHETDPRPKVAMLTAVKPDFELIDQECDTYLTKPVTRHELVDVVERLVDVATYPQPLQELYALTERYAVLETEMPADQLASSDEFAALEAEILRREDRIRSDEGRIEDDEIRAMVERISHDAETSSRGVTD